ncbi:MAG: 50S ribosomal protein L16 [Candidatus Shikimatogenerans sp. Tcar]|uniref:50S ribosomal protein L16 n=1 Tax=Candidatus Shikimatogenerans sp. Tcar TaxID=3158565 RepID=A0AAU7QUQ1_9FLAO
MLEPKKNKFIKVHKRRLKGLSYRGNILSFGDYGIKSIDKFKFINQKQIESARVAINKFLKKGSKLYINIFPNKPITKKPQEVRMGKGKGNFDTWVCPVKPGRILFEIKGINYNIAYKALLAGSHKLPIKTKIIISKFIYD